MTADHIAAGTGLPQRWAGRDHFVVLETRFGLGQGFLAAWAAWRGDPQRCRCLHYIAIDASPPSADELMGAHRDGVFAALANQLIDSWPALTPNTHRIDFDDARVQLVLVVDELGLGLRELVAEVDAFVLEPSTTATPDASWQPRWCKRLARLAAPQATVTSSLTDPVLLDGLRSAGFDLTVVIPRRSDFAPTFVGRFTPRFVPKRPVARQARRSNSPRDAIILGAGLAGCSTAAALAAQGWAVTLIDRHPSPAAEASGNSAGVFHGVVHAHDGHHARLNRAAALAATQTYRKLLANVSALTPGQRAGSVDGLLRMGSKLVDLATMNQVLHRLRLPPAFVQALDVEQASALAGLTLTDAAWFYPGGGWMRPGWLAARWLKQAAGACRFIGGVEVAAIRPGDAGGWDALDGNGTRIAGSANLVLANADGACRLLDGLVGNPIDWPLQRVRGQSSRVELTAGLCAPCLPLSGAGYVLPMVDSALMFGATAQAEDDCAAVRAADHRENAARLAQLSPDFDSVSKLSIEVFDGRTAWRCVSSDRLPLIGAVPQAWAGGSGGDRDQPRLVARQPGLYLFTALGSRGITWAPLGSVVLAALMTGAPVPLEAALLDAIDPARFLSRAHRRKAAVDRSGTG